MDGLSELKYVHRNGCARNGAGGRLSRQDLRIEYFNNLPSTQMRHIIEWEECLGPRRRLQLRPQIHPCSELFPPGGLTSDR